MISFYSGSQYEFKANIEKNTQPYQIRNASGNNVGHLLHNVVARSTSLGPTSGLILFFKSVFRARLGRGPPRHHALRHYSWNKELS
jgi:hypothetical protein